MLRVLALGLMLLGQQEHNRHPAAADPTSLGADAQGLLRGFETATAPAQMAYAALAPSAPVATQLRVRATLDQAMRESWPDGAAAKLTDADRDALDTIVAERVRVVDDANTSYLRAHLPGDGWFRQSRDGEQVASDAWLIAQHSSDMSFQAAVAARMAPLAASGEVKGSHYALIYDRTEMFAGRPQFYGSQVACKNGQWQPVPIRDAATVDARRRQVGMQPLAEYMKGFTGSC